MKKNYTNLVFKLLSIFLFLPIVLLSSCDSIPGLDKETIINDLLPNIWIFITHIICATILIIVLTLLVWKPFKKILKKRCDYVNKEVKDADKIKLEATIELNKANQTKINAITQSSTIIDNAKKDAKNIINIAKIDAKNQAKQIINQLNIDIKRKKENLKNDIRQNVINVAFDVASNILKKKIVKNNDSEINEIISKIDKKINYDK